LFTLSQTPETQTRLPTAAEQVATEDGVVGSGLPFGIFGVQSPSVPVVMSHQSAFGQFASVVHAVAHVPLAVLQTGVSMGHCEEAVHWTHVLLPVSQIDVPPAHSALSMHATQRPAFVPLVAHVIDRQSAVPSLAVQGPSPLAYPHLLSLTSHTPLTQTSVPAAAVQVPLRVGFVWVGSVGTAVPFGDWATHWWIVSRHHVPVAQSASTLHPPAGSQVRFVLHSAERQSVAPSVAVHGPSPLA
jgi:hypothetical protein